MFITPSIDIRDAVQQLSQTIQQESGLPGSVWCSSNPIHPTMLFILHHLHSFPSSSLFTRLRFVYARPVSIDCTYPSWGGRPHKYVRRIQSNYFCLLHCFVSTFPSYIHCYIVLFCTFPFYRLKEGWSFCYNIEKREIRNTPHHDLYKRHS